MAEAKKTKTRKGFCYYIAADSDPERRMYIGSSMRTPLGRKANHKCGKGNSATTATPIIQFADWNLHVIEWYDLEGTKEEAMAELRQYEQSWIEILRVDCINKMNASGHNEEKKKAYRKAWKASEEGKAKTKQTEKKYKASEKGKAVQIKHRASEKYKTSRVEYYKRNCERIAEYYKANRERILAQQREKRQDKKKKQEAVSLA